MKKIIMVMLLIITGILLTGCIDAENKKNTEIKQIPKNFIALYFSKYSPYKKIESINDPSHLDIYDLDTGEFATSIDYPGYWDCKINVSPNGNILYVASFGEMDIYDTSGESLKFIKYLYDKDDLRNKLYKTTWYIHDDYYDLQNDKIYFSIPIEKNIASAYDDYYGKKLGFEDNDYILGTYNIKTEEMEKKIKFSDPALEGKNYTLSTPFSVPIPIFSRDRKYVGVCYELSTILYDKEKKEMNETTDPENKVYIFDTLTEKLVYKTSSYGWGTVIKFSEDGKRLYILPVFSSNDKLNNFRIVDTTTWQEIVSLSIDKDIQKPDFVNIPRGIVDFITPNIFEYKDKIYICCSTMYGVSKEGAYDERSYISVFDSKTGKFIKHLDLGEKLCNCKSFGLWQYNNKLVLFKRPVLDGTEESMAAKSMVLYDLDTEKIIYEKEMYKWGQGNRMLISSVTGRVRN